MIPKQPNNSAARLVSRQPSVLLSIPPESSHFQDFLALATCISATPYAIILLIDNKGYYQYFTSPHCPENLVEVATLALEKFSPDELIIWNPALDFQQSPETPQFYASVPLLNPHNQSIGILAVIDQVSQDLTTQQQQALQTLARQIGVHLKLIPSLTLPLLHPYPAIACDFDGQVIDYNPATTALLQQLGLEQVDSLLPVAHAQLVKSCFNKGQNRDGIEVRVGERVFRWLYQPFPDAAMIHLYAVEVTAYKQTETLLLHEACHDSLTGLPNRNVLMERLQQAIHRTHRHHSSINPHKTYQFALLFLDIDRFTLINDSLGHLAGDRLLDLIARRLEKTLRPTDTLARLGGDEFAILLDHLQDTAEAIAVAEQIHQLLAAPFHLNTPPLECDSDSDNALTPFQEVFTNASIGITLSSLGYERPEQLLRDADIALHRAKAKGRGRYEVFNPELYTRAVTLLQLENDLRRALKRQEFLLHYQPIISLDVGRIMGFEALVRWRHPERGLVSPGEFIPIAEETGLIVPLGAWVLQESCRQLRQWQDQFPGYPPLTISVNLSGKQLAHPNFIQQVDQVLRESQLEPGSLKLEITESVLMENAEAAAALLHQLRAQQIHLCIDDFGTGYSSLSYLQRFPINMLKIDQSFVSQMHINQQNLEIVRAIIALASNLGMYVTAEGVSTEEHLVQLWALHCDYAQGFFFSKALDRENATRLLQEAPQW